MLPQSTRPPGGVQATARRAVLRRIRQFIEVSRDGASPLADAELDGLLPQLEYDHRKFLYGEEAIDPVTGDRHRVRVTHKRLWQLDGAGRLVAGAGFTDRIHAHFASAGYAVRFIDTNPVRRAGRGPDTVFDPQWRRLLKYPEFNCAIQDGADFDQLCFDVGAGPSPFPGNPELIALARRVKQRAILEAIFRRAYKGLGGVIQAVPAVGKSYLMAAAALALPKAKIGCAVPDRDNFNKTFKHFSRYLPDVGRVGIGKRKHRRVTVYTAQSLHHAEEDLDLLLLDEMHRYAADEVSGTLMKVAPYAVRVGLTATPSGRTDGADLKLEAIAGPVAYRVGWPEATRLGLVTPIEVRWLAMDLDENPAANPKLPPWLRERVGIFDNEPRNRRFAAVARKLPADAQVLYMVRSVRHALRLRRLLPDFTVVYGVHDADQFAKHDAADLLDDDFVPINGDRREEMRLAFEAGELRRVIATDVWSTGVSFDGLSVLLRVDARRSPILDEQIPSRACRVQEGKPLALVYDSLDQFDSGWHSAALARRKNYTEKGWAQVLPGGVRR